MKDPVLRRALFTVADVPQMISKTVGQFDSTIKPLGNRIFVPQQPGYQNNLGTLGSGDVAKAWVSSSTKILMRLLMSPERRISRRML